jgi:Kef-type K+ transport system membrane component KefB
MSKSLSFYALLLVVFGLGMYGVLTIGSLLVSEADLAPAPAAAAVAQEAPAAAPAPLPAKAVGGIAGIVSAAFHHPLALLLLQILVIVAAARGLGALFARFRQPRVIGEMIAGILLGPSLFGMVLPDLQGAVFPAASLGSLQMLSQIGVILFLFVVGIELDVNLLRRKADAAVLVSHSSILVPFFLGSAGALFFYGPLAPAGIPFSAFALFLGVAMSITAFPVLARILEDRKMSRTMLGGTAITCAAVDDVTAWCLLAVVIALARADGLAGSAVTIVMTLVFIGAMLYVVRPWLSRVLAAAKARDEESGEEHGALSSGLLAGILLFVFASALATELIGIHALFGAFLAGICMPQDSALRHALRERLEGFSTAFLLPLFFAFTGLRTQIGLLDSWVAWAVCASVIAIAIAGKLGGTMIAARWTGMSWGDSFSLGALMNTRGLVELIVLNLGYDLGILSPRIFAMMVLMALITTFMTGPLLQLRDVFSRRAEEPADAAIPA